MGVDINPKITRSTTNPEEIKSYFKDKDLLIKTDDLSPISSDTLLYYVCSKDAAMFLKNNPQYEEFKYKADNKEYLVKDIIEYLRLDNTGIHVNLLGHEDIKVRGARQ